jgi:uncharacterized membrane protein YidH (DUF202 family)
MINLLFSLDSILVNILVIIGIFIIASGAIKRKKQEDAIEEFRQFLLIRSHLTVGIVLASSLFSIKFL